MSDTASTVTPLDGEQHLRLAYAVAYRVKPPRGFDPEDWCQEAVLALLRAAPRYDPAWGVSPGTYLWRRVHSRLLQVRGKYLRQSAREKVMTDLDYTDPDGEKGRWETGIADDPAEGTDAQALQHETQEQTLQLLHTLPPREQAIVRDHILEGKPLAQIGDEPVVHPI